MIVSRIKNELAECYAGKPNSDLDPEVRAEVDEQFRGLFIGDRGDGAYGWWLSDDGHDGVMRLFRMVYDPVVSAVAERLGLQTFHFMVLVEPCLEDSSYVAIIHRPLSASPRMVFLDQAKYWRMRWDSENEMERELQGVAAQIVAALAGG